MRLSYSLIFALFTIILAYPTPTPGLSVVDQLLLRHRSDVIGEDVEDVGLKYQHHE